MFVIKAVKNSKLWTRHLCSVSKTTEEKINVNGMKINYVSSGSGDETVLLMPGALGSAWTDFKPQIENLPKLLKNYRVIAWDPPGYGSSIPPKRTFGSDFFRRDAETAHSLMENLGVKKYSILGWSDGGITAMIVAANNQKSVEKLVFWGSNSYIVADEIKIYQNIRDVKKWSPKMREPLEKLYGAEYFAKTWNEWVDTFVKLSKESDGDICSSDLPNILAKTLILHGAKDPMIAPEHIPFLMDKIQGAKLHVFPDGKHNIHLRYAEEFNKIVADFLIE